MTHNAFLHSTRESLKVLIEHAKRHLDAPGIDEIEYREAEQAYIKLLQAYAIISEAGTREGGNNDI